MSLYSLARDAARSSPGPAGATTGLAREEGLRDNALTNAASALAKYIPKEIVTLYIAGLSAGPAFKSVLGFGNRTVYYCAFVVLTGPIYLLVYLSFLKANQKPIPPRSQWPWWRLVASVIAFGTWGLAVPGNPFISGNSGALVAGFLALFISTLLSLADPWLDSVPTSPEG
jgi:hypothetical protein